MSHFHFQTHMLYSLAFHNYYIHLLCIFYSSSKQTEVYLYISPLPFVYSML